MLALDGRRQIDELVGQIDDVLCNSSVEARFDPGDRLAPYGFHSHKTRKMQTDKAPIGTISHFLRFAPSDRVDPQIPPVDRFTVRF